MSYIPTLCCNHYQTWFYPDKQFTIWGHRDYHPGSIPCAWKHHDPECEPAGRRVDHHRGDGSTLRNGHSWNPNGHYQLADRGWYQLHVAASAMTTTLTSAGVLWWTPYRLTQSQWYKVAPSWTWAGTGLYVSIVFVCEIVREWMRQIQ